MNIDTWSSLIGGIAALAVGMVAAAGVEQARAQTAHAVAISLIPTCTTNYGVTTNPQGLSVSVVTLTCPCPAPQATHAAAL